MTTRREHDAHTAATAAIARATAHIPNDIDWPEPVPVDARPESQFVTPEIARQIRLEAEENHP